MVLDNVDNVEVFFPKQKPVQDGPSGTASAPPAAYLPQSHNGSILITSRSKDAAALLTGSYKNIMEIPTMNESQGLQLLRNKLDDVPNEDSATSLLSALDYIPLAISQAATYINRRARMTVSGYLDEFHKNNKKRANILYRDAGDLRRDASASNSVVTTWQMSFEHIREERRSTADLLSLMSFFNPQGIPESVLRSYSKSTVKVDDEEDAESEFDDDLDTLRAYSLVTVTTDSNTCEMHALVQFCTRAWLSSFSDAERWRRKFLWLMAREFPTGEFESWAKCQRLLPHVEPMFESEPADEESQRNWAEVLTNAAWYMSMKGSYKAAHDVIAKAVINRERTLGHDNVDTLTSVTVLVSVLRRQGKYDEAEKISRRVLEGSEKELGKQHPDTLTSVSNLALVLRDQGKYDEAEKMNRRALEGWEKELGKQHPSTLTSVSNLALVLQDQGKYDEAETLNRRVLEERQKELGKQHPSTLMSVSNLASVLRGQGKYEEAEKMNQRALEGREKELGKQHPDTLTSVGNVASVLQDQGKYEEAEKMNRRALEGREKELGKDHPDTLNSVHWLAYLLHRRRRYEAASELYQRACDGYKKKLGSQHPRTIACLNNYSTMQQEAGQGVVLQIRERIHGDKAPHTERSDGNEQQQGENML
jgi:tetratricopeptide (TPR) repeat protein